MRVFKRETNSSGIYIFNNDEIETVKACSGFTQPGTSEVTNCYDEGCYSFDNSVSCFKEDLLNDFNKIFKTKFEYFDDLEEEYENQGVLQSFINEYKTNNEVHEEREVIFTGEGSNIIFLDNSDWEEITDDDEGKEIINNFMNKEHEGDHGTGAIYSSKKYTFFSSRIAGDCAGYQVESLQP